MVVGAPKRWWRSSITHFYPRLYAPRHGGASDDAIARPAWSASGCGRRQLTLRGAVVGDWSRCRRRSTGTRAGRSGSDRQPRASDVDAAFDAGAILRTHVLRPTWHFAAQDDLRWLLALTGPILERRNARRDEELELDARTRRRATDLIADAVRTGPLTGANSRRCSSSSGIATDGQRIAHLLFHAELHAAVCSGPMRGKVHTYAAFDTRVPPGVAHEGEAALAELARRWFTTRGPATLRDFAWWSGLPMADAACRARGRAVGADVVRT